MNGPTLENIDRWLFDWSEGNLNSDQIAQLEAFILEHPEVETDKDAWAASRVEASEVVYQQSHQFIKRRPYGLYFVSSSLALAAVISTGVYSSFFISKYSPNYLEAYHIKEIGKVLGMLNRNESNSSRPYKALKRSGKFTIDKESLVSANTKFALNPITDNQDFLNPETNYFKESLYITSFQIPTQVAKNIQRSENEGSVSIINRDFGTHKVIRSNYSTSLNNRIAKLGRNLQRMLDNPVALKNKKDPYFHVPGLQPTDINFGIVGTLVSTRFQSLTRAQWYGETNEQWVNQLNVDGYSYGLRGGIGVQMNHAYYADGSIQNYSGSITYSPKFSISSQFMLEPSIRYKMGAKSLGNTNNILGTEVEFDRQNKQKFYEFGQQPVGKNLYYKDLGMGLMLNTRWFYTGVQLDNLFNHYDNLYTADLTNQRRAGKHFIATIGTDYVSKKESLSLSPYLVYQKFENLSEAWIGFQGGWNILRVGGAISSQMEPAVSLGVKTKHFSLSYQGDLTYSSLLNEKALSHQLSLRIITAPSRFGKHLLNL